MMKKFRIFFDKDNENKWLNQMAKDGYSLINFSMGNYQFEETEKGEYAYQIDLYDDDKNKFDQFCDEMKQDGVEVVCKFGRWVYLRKPVSDGEIKAYTDDLMKSEQYERLGRFCLTFMFVELVVAMLSFMSHNYIVAAILVVVAVFFFVLMFSFGRKAQILRGE